MPIDIIKPAKIKYNGFEEIEWIVEFILKYFSININIIPIENDINSGIIFFIRIHLLGEACFNKAGIVPKISPMKPKDACNL